MAWKIEFEAAAKRDLDKLDQTVAKRILKFLSGRVAQLDDPRQIGEPLQGPLRKLWKYRVGDYRLLCSLEDDRFVVMVARLGHRSKIYSR
jgi:mRNA interferase RelE/StbE